MCTSQCWGTSSLTSQCITWSWRTGISSPAPKPSPSCSLSRHTVAGEPSQKVEDRNWPIRDLGQLRLRRAPRSEGDCSSLTTQNRKWQQSQGHCDRALVNSLSLYYSGRRGLPRPLGCPSLSFQSCLVRDRQLALSFPQENWVEKKMYKNNLVTHLSYTRGKLWLRKLAKVSEGVIHTQIMFYVCTSSSQQWFEWLLIDLFQLVIKFSTSFPIVI